MLNHKLNYIKDEDDKITKFFNCFNISEAKWRCFSKVLQWQIKYKKESNDMRKNIEEIKNDIKELKDLKGLIEKLALSVDELKKN